jgi:HEPN domain-containing protein
MPNKTSAIEWLRIASHEIGAAKILYEADHFTDSIGSLLQQSIEKSLKALLAYDNKKILKSHDLVEIYSLVHSKIDLGDDIELLEIATEYYKEDRYPNPNYTLPPKEEIKIVMDFSQKLFDIVCEKLKIKKDDIVDER